jgi:hypothetical protein
LSDGKVFSKDFLVPFAAYLVVLLYLRMTALQLKDVAIRMRLKHLDRINQDLGLLRRTFLLFKPAKEWPIFRHVYYYLLVGTSFAAPFLFQQVGGPDSIHKPFYWEATVIFMSILLLGARVLAADLLALRFLSGAQNTEAPRTITSSSSVS